MLVGAGQIATLLGLCPNPPKALPLEPAEIPCDFLRWGGSRAPFQPRLDFTKCYLPRGNSDGQRGLYCPPPERGGRLGPMPRRCFGFAGALCRRCETSCGHCISRDPPRYRHLSLWRSAWRRRAPRAPATAATSRTAHALSRHLSCPTIGRSHLTKFVLHATQRRDPSAPRSQPERSSRGSCQTD